MARPAIDEKASKSASAAVDDEDLGVAKKVGVDERWRRLRIPACLPPARPCSRRDPRTADARALLPQVYSGSSNILVVVRVRPILKHDRHPESIIKVLDRKVRQHPPPPPLRLGPRARSHAPTPPRPCLDRGHPRPVQGGDRQAGRAAGEPLAREAVRVRRGVRAQGQSELCVRGGSRCSCRHYARCRHCCPTLLRHLAHLTPPPPPPLGTKTPPSFSSKACWTGSTPPCSRTGRRGRERLTP